jgi:hypothetical protein
MIGCIKIRPSVTLTDKFKSARATQVVSTTQHFTSLRPPNFISTSSSNQLFPPSSNKDTNLPTTVVKHAENGATNTVSQPIAAGNAPQNLQAAIDQ